MGVPSPIAARLEEEPSGRARFSSSGEAGGAAQVEPLLGRAGPCSRMRGRHREAENEAQTRARAKEPPLADAMWGDRSALSMAPTTSEAQALSAAESVTTLTQSAR